MPLRSGPSNTTVLSHSSTVWAAKKRQKKEQIKEVVFDDDARRDYLTGFHKRKLLKQQAAKAKAIEKEKQEHLKERAEKRKDLRERARKNYQEVERALGGGEDLDDDIEGDIPPGKGKDAEEYSDEEQFATVTVVEDFDPSVAYRPPSLPRDVDGAAPPPRPNVVHKPSYPPKSKTKSKSTKIRYETKAARKTAKTKERARKLEKASLAKDKQGKKSQKRKR